MSAQPYWILPYFVIHQLETHDTPALLIFIHASKLKLIHSAHGMELSDILQTKIVQIVPTIRTSLYTGVSLSDDSMIFAFPCTSLCIVYKPTPWVQAFFSSFISYISKLSLPKVFANGNFIECTDDNFASALSAFGSSKSLQWYTLLSIDMQPIFAYFNKISLYKISTTEIFDHIVMIFANLNPELALTIKKNNTTIFYVFFHKHHYASNFILQPFCKLLDLLLQVPQTFIKIVETRSINQTITDSQ